MTVLRLRCNSKALVWGVLCLYDRFVIATSVQRLWAAILPHPAVSFWMIATEFI